MLTLHRAGLCACLCVLSAVPALAQSEAELRDVFEGKSVRVKIDMPGTQEGIDVYPDARRPIDMNQYSQRLKSYGVAVHSGDSVMVTRVRVKDEVKKDRIAAGRLHGGSRFNIRYQNGVPPGLDAGGVMRALEQYVDFPFATDRQAPRQDLQPPFNPSAIRKGMAIADVEAMLGRPEKSTQRKEGALSVTSNAYASGDQVITAEFVEGVLIKYSTSSR